MSDKPIKLACSPWCHSMHSMLIDAILNMIVTRTTRGIQASPDYSTDLHFSLIEIWLHLRIVKVGLKVAAAQAMLTR